jgi:hypothetical protein
MRRGGRPGLVGTVARTAVVAGTATAVSNRVTSRQQARADQRYAAEQYEAQQQAAMYADAQQQAAPPPPAAPPAAAPAAAPSGGSDLMEQLQQLAGLHQQGILSDEEFAAAKAKLLS